METHLERIVAREHHHARLEGIPDVDFVKALNVVLTKAINVTMCCAKHAQEASDESAAYYERVYGAHPDEVQQ